MVRNIRYAVRSWRKSPGMALTAIIALALGVGANTALFSVVYAVLLRPLQYPHPERIVEVMRHYPGADVWSTTSTKFEFWRRENDSFKAVAAYTFLPVGMNLAGLDEPQQLAGEPVTSDYFRVFAARPLLGRTWPETADRPGAGHYVVLSYGLWERLFHRDPHAIGKSLSLNGGSYQVLGIMPADFETSLHPDLWTPLQLKVDPRDSDNEYNVIARVRPGVSFKAAERDMQLVAQRFRRTYGSDLIDKDESIHLVRYREFLVGDVWQQLWILLAAVGLVLLVACANVANLLLARSAGRRHEMAIRAAVGATNWQIVRQLLTESLLLSLAGTAAGVMVAAFLLPLLVRLAPVAIPRLGTTAVDGQVLLYALGIAVLTGVLFGLFPAVQSTKSGGANPLRSAGDRTSTNAGTNRLRQGLVIAEVGVSVMLLAGAGLLIETMRNLQSVQPGFDAHHVLTMQMSLRDHRFDTTTAVTQLTDRVSRRLEAMPGVVSAGTTSFLPFYPYADLPFEIVGRPVTRDHMPDEKWRRVSPQYFSTLKVPLIAGRGFSDRDTAQSLPVLIVNEAFAKKYFPGQSAIGQQILIGRIMGPAFADKPRQIVGVVGSIRDAGLNRPAPPEFFEPESQFPTALTAMFNQLAPLHWVIRTMGDPMAMAERIRREVLSVSGNVPMADPRPLRLLVSDSVARQRFVMQLLGIFAGLGLLLGTVGLYGVISYSVAQRTREMGIRNALGAQRSDLLKLVVGQGMRLSAFGIGLGVVGAVAAAQFLRGILYGVSPSDPLLLAGVATLMGAVALLACLLPAYRASRVDPLVALREE